MFWFNCNTFGDNLEKDVETSELFEEASKKLIFIIFINHGSNYDKENIEKSFKSIIEENHFKEATLDNIAETIVNIIVDAAENNANTIITHATTPTHVNTNENGEIVW